MSPDQILDRTEACQTLGISRQTLMSWIRKGKLKVWKRVGTGSNSALLFDRRQIETLRASTRDVGSQPSEIQIDSSKLSLKANS
jgi:excisionase family DNA binding protein